MYRCIQHLLWRISHSWRQWSNPMMQQRDHVHVANSNPRPRARATRQNGSVCKPEMTCIVFPPARRGNAQLGRWRRRRKNGVHLEGKDRRKTLCMCWGTGLLFGNDHVLYNMCKYCILYMEQSLMYFKYDCVFKCYVFVFVFLKTIVPFNVFNHNVKMLILNILLFHSYLPNYHFVRFFNKIFKNKIEYHRKSLQLIR